MTEICTHLRRTANLEEDRVVLDRVEHRKDVWRAVRDLKGVLLLAPINHDAVKDLKPGIVVYVDEREQYCDGRVDSQTLGKVEGREVIYIPLVEPEEAN